MKNTLLVGLVIGVAACGNVDDTGQATSESLRAEVEGFLAEYRLAIESRDADVVSNFYIDDGRFEWIEDGRVQYESPDDVVAGLAALPVDVTFRTEYSGIDVTRVGRDAARAAMQFRTVLGDGPSAYEFGGMVSMLLERGPSRWRIVTGHSSTERPDRR